MKITKEELRKIIKEAILAELAITPEPNKAIYADRPAHHADYGERKAFFHRPPMGSTGSHELETLRQIGYKHGGTTFEDRLHEKMQEINEKLDLLLSHVGLV